MSIEYNIITYFIIHCIIYNTTQFDNLTVQFDEPYRRHWDTICINTFVWKVDYQKNPHQAGIVMSFQ